MRLACVFLDLGKSKSAQKCYSMHVMVGSSEVRPGYLHPVTQWSDRNCQSSWYLTRNHTHCLPGFLQEK